MIDILQKNDPKKSAKKNDPKKHCAVTGYLVIPSKEQGQRCLCFVLAEEFLGAGFIESKIPRLWCYQRTAYSCTPETDNLLKGNVFGSKAIHTRVSNYLQ